MSDEVDDVIVASRADFMRFVRLLRQELRQTPGKWENHSLPAFLEALEAYVGAIQQVYANNRRAVDADVPHWQTFADILRGASIYE